MNRKLLLALPAILLIACGAQPEEDTSEASALDIMPDASLFSMAFVDPAAVVSSLDSYASGVPVLGENAVSGWILSALDCADMNEVDSKLGIRTQGGIAFFMESMMPQSLGAAISVSDPDVFWTNIGITPMEAEPLEDGQQVSKIPVDFGDIYFCHTNGLLLAAGSRAGLASMLARIDGEMPAGMPSIPPGSFYMYANIELFGPMMASQLAMLEPQLLSEMEAAEDGPDPQMMQSVMGMYFDMFRLMLNETKSVSIVVTMDDEYITGTSDVEFVPGSSLDTYLVPVEPRDMTGLIPAGDVAMGRFSLDPSTSRAAMNAVFQAMDFQDVPQDMVDFWAQCAQNTAMSWMLDGSQPLHIVAVYQMPDGTGLEDVLEAYDQQFQMMSQFLTMPGLTLSSVDYAEYQGIQWVTFGMNMDMAAMAPEMEDPDAPQMDSNIGWTAWLTMYEGDLYLEMGQEPATVAAIVQGTYQGSTAMDDPMMGQFDDSAEIAFLLNLPGYLNMALNMTGMELPSIESDPVWMQFQVDITDGGVNHYFRVSGGDMMVFIGQAIQTFSEMAAEQQ